MIGTRRLSVTLLFATVAIALAACSGDETAPAAQDSASHGPEEDRYLTSVENNVVQITAALAQVDEDLRNVWPLPSMLFQAFEDSNVTGEIRSALSGISSLAPPDGYREDHDRLMASRDQMNGFTEQMDQAIASSDLVALAVSFANLQVVYRRALAASSESFCDAAEVNVSGPPLCDSDQQTNPDSYEAQVERLFKQYRAEFEPRVVPNVPAMQPDQTLATLEQLNREVESAIQIAMDQLRGLQPPGDLADDHQGLLTYFEENLDTAHAITLAAAARDTSQIEPLFAQSGTVLCNAIGNISEETAQSILNGWFAGGPDGDLPPFCSR